MRMIDHRIYFLRTKAQIEDFRRRYARFIAAEGENYVRWVQGFPLCEWVDYLKGVPEKNIPVLVGMLCHLYLSGRIYITFHDTQPLVCRDPSSEKEWNAWVASQATPLKIPGKRRK